MLTTLCTQRPIQRTKFGLLKMINEVTCFLQIVQRFKNEDYIPINLRHKTHCGVVHLTSYPSEAFMIYPIDK